MTMKDGEEKLEDALRRIFEAIKPIHDEVEGLSTHPALFETSADGRCGFTSAGRRTYEALDGANLYLRITLDRLRDAYATVHDESHIPPRCGLGRMVDAHHARESTPPSPSPRKSKKEGKRP